jgi:phosphatidylglycerol lysyltransferase
VAVVYQATAAERPWLVRAGFRLFKVGEEAVIDLASFDTAGPRRANLRHTITRCRKDGVVFRWFPAGIPDNLSSLIDDLEAVDAEWCKRAGPEIGFTISHFQRCALSRQPICVAVGADGRALACASFCRTGLDGGWVLDLMRRTPDGPPGAVEACIAEAAREFRASGALTLSLGLAPLANLDHSSPILEERLLSVGAGLVHRWYDVAGLARFKNKFDPDWIPRYGAIRRRRDIVGFTIALLLVHVKVSSLWPRRFVRARPTVARVGG